LTDKLMTVKEAADYLDLSYITVYRLARRRRIPAMKIGGTWRFKKEVLDRWLEEGIASSKAKVLVVDDDARVRDMLVEIVSGQGYEVEAVGTGEEALELIKSLQFDLVFLDLVLPGISGIEVLRALKKKAAKTIVVVVTAYGDEPIATEALSLSPFFLIRKPFATSEVRQILDIALRVPA